MQFAVDDSLKEAWTAILKGDNQQVRGWVHHCVDWSQPLPTTEYALQASGHARYGAFFTAIAELIDRTPPPSKQALVDHFAMHGVFFARDLPHNAVDTDAGEQETTATDFSRLLVLLARCNLLFRSSEVTGQLRHALQILLPFERVSPFHHFMIRHCLQHDLKSILEVYLIWYGLNKLPFDAFFDNYKKFSSDVASFPSDFFVPTVSAAQHKLASSRTTVAGVSSYDGGAVLASVLSFPTQPVELRKQIYDSLLKSYNQASDAHALVERVVTGSAAALRRELAEGIGLVDASAQSVTINEIRELCTHLTEVINDGDTMPEQAADPVDPMTGEVLQHVHSTWRAADDVHSSTRDVALMAIMGTFFDAHFAGEGEDMPNVLSVFGMEEEKISDVALGDAAQAQSLRRYPPVSLLDLDDKAPSLNDDCSVEATGAQHMHALRHLLIIGRPLQAFDTVFRYLLSLSPALAAQSESEAHTAAFQNRRVAAMYRNFVDLAHKCALANSHMVDISNSCLVFLDLMERLASTRPGATVSASSSRMMARLAFLVEVGRALINSETVTNLPADEVANLLYAAHRENRDLHFKMQSEATSANAPAFSFFASRAPRAMEVMQKLQAATGYLSRQAFAESGNSASGQAAAASASQALRLLAAASLVFNLPLPAQVSSLAAPAVEGSELIRFVFAAAEILDVPTHFFLAHLNRAPSGLERDALRSLPSTGTLLERLALVLGGLMGVVVGPNVASSHPWHAAHPGAPLRWEPTSAYLHRVALAFRFAEDVATDVSLQLAVTDPRAPMAAVRESGALMLMHALELSAAGRPTDSILPALAMHYPGATRLDCMLVYLRCAYGRCSPLPARVLQVDGTYMHPFADTHHSDGAVTRLFNPGYAPELLAELAEAQQFALLAEAFELFFPNAALNHFVRYLGALTHDCSAAARQHIAEFVRVQKLTAWYGAHAIAATAAAAAEDIDAAELRAQVTVGQAAVADEPLLDSEPSDPAARHEARVAAAAALGPHVHLIPSDPAYTAQIARRMLKSLRSRRPLRNKYIAALVEYSLANSGFQEVEPVEGQEEADDALSMSSAATDRTGLEIAHGNIPKEGRSVMSTASRAGAGSALQERMWAEKMQQFRDFQKSFLYQFSAERVNFVEEARLYFKEHGVSALLAGCFFYRVLFASLRSPFDEQLRVISVLLQLWDNQSDGQLADLWRNLHGLRCWLEMLVSPPAGAILDKHPAPVALPADRTRGLYLLTAPEESAYLPKTRSHELNTVLLEAVLHRLLNDHRFNEAARLIHELQLYSLTLTPSLSSLLEVLPALFFLAGFPFDAGAFPAPLTQSQKVAAALEKKRADFFAIASRKNVLPVDASGKVALTAEALAAVQHEHDHAQQAAPVVAAAASLPAQAKTSHHAAAEARADAEARAAGYFGIDSHDWLGALLSSFASPSMLVKLGLPSEDSGEQPAAASTSWLTSAVSALGTGVLGEKQTTAVSAKSHFLHKVVRAVLEQTQSGKVLCGVAAAKPMVEPIALPGLVHERVGVPLDSIHHAPMFSWQTQNGAFDQLLPGEAAPKAVDEEAEEARRAALSAQLSAAAAAVTCFNREGTPLPLTTGQRAAVFARAATAFPGIRACVEAMALLAELRYELSDGQSTGFDLFVEIACAKGVSEAVRVALAKVIGDSDFFAAFTAANPDAPPQPKPARLNRLLVKLQRLGLLSAAQCADTLDAALRTFLMNADSMTKATRAKWCRATYITFARCMEGYDLRAAAALGARLQQSAHEQMSSISGDRDAAAELWLAAYFSHLVSGDEQGCAAVLKAIDNAHNSLRLDQICRIMELTGEFEALPSCMKVIISRGSDGASVLNRDLAPRDPLYVARITGGVHAGAAMYSSSLLKASFRHDYANVALVEQNWRLQHALYEARQRLSGVEFFFQAEAVAHGLVNLARSARAADRHSEALIAMKCARLIHLEMSMEPARVRARFNWTNPSAGDVHAIVAHYASTPMTADPVPADVLLAQEALAKSASRTSFMSSAPAPVVSESAAPMLDGPGGVLHESNATLITVQLLAAASQPVKASSVHAEKDDQWLSKAQFVRLAADAAFANWRSAAIDEVWTAVSQRKRVRDPQLGTAFTELRSRVEQMVRSTAQVVRPQAGGDIRFVRRSELAAVMCPRDLPACADADAKAAVKAAENAAEALVRLQQPYDDEQLLVQDSELSRVAEFTELRRKRSIQVASAVSKLRGDRPAVPAAPLSALYFSKRTSGYERRALALRPRHLETARALLGALNEQQQEVIKQFYQAVCPEDAAAL